MAIPISVGQILELKLVAIWNSAMNFNNIFHYEVTNSGTGAGSPATVDEFLGGFLHDVIPSIRELNSPLTVYTSIQGNVRDKDTFNLINGETLFFVPSLPGLKAGGSNAPFVCWTFKYLRETTAFRHGFKRIGDVPQDDEVNGAPINSTVVGALNTLAGKFAAPLTAWTLVDGVPTTQVTGASAKVVVPQRFREHTALSPVLYSNTPSVVFDKVGSQNSRKIGVGV